MHLRFKFCIFIVRFPTTTNTMDIAKTFFGIENTLDDHTRYKTKTIAFIGIFCLILFKLADSRTFLSSNLPDLFGDAEFSGIVYYFFLVFLIMFLVPAYFFSFFIKEQFQYTGFRTGDFKRGMRYVITFLPLILLFFVIPAAKNELFQDHYPLYSGLRKSMTIFMVYQVLYALYYFSYEFFFRGFLLFGLKDSLGSLKSVTVVTILTTLAHIGKPYPEILICIPAGFFFGYIAFKTRSFLYVFLMHWVIGMALDTFILLQPEPVKGGVFVGIF